MDRENKQNLIKYGGAILGILVAVFLVFKVIIPKVINSNTKVAIEGLLPLIIFILTVLIINKILLASSIEWLKRIMMGQDNYLTEIAPVISDFKLRDYYSKFQIELGSEFVGIGFIGTLPVIGSLISALATLNFFRVLFVEGYEYMTDELFMAFMIAVIAYILLLNCRSLALADIINSCKNRTYMASTALYVYLPKVTAVAWFLCFILPLIIKPLGRLTNMPIFNLISIIIPIVILPAMSYIGIKKMSKDIISSYDMNSVLNAYKNKFNAQQPQPGGYVSSDFYQEQGGYQQGNQQQGRYYQDGYNQGYNQDNYNQNNQYR